MRDAGARHPDVFREVSASSSPYPFIVIELDSKLTPTDLLPKLRAVLVAIGGVHRGG